jgi:hypothetical protein
MIHDFGIHGMLNDAIHEYVGKDSASPGETVSSLLWLLVPELQCGRLHLGFEFTVKEPTPFRIVAHGRITNVLNSDLLKRDPF